MPRTDLVRKALAICGPLLMVALVTGCSGGDQRSAPSQQSLTAWYRGFSSAFKTKDWAALYPMMSPGYRANCPFDDFKAQMLLVSGAVGEAYFRADFTIADIVISGSRATFTSTARSNNQTLVSSSGNKALWVDGAWYSDADCSPGAVPSPTAVPPLSFGQRAELPNSQGLAMTVLSIESGVCDGGSAILVQVEIENNSDQYSRAIPTIVVRAPDGQQNQNFIGFSDHPNFYNLPQGLPPRSKTTAYYCVATDNHNNRGQFVGPIPSSLTGWIVDSQVGPKWQAR